MHLLFTQVHLLFDSSAEGQYATIAQKTVYDISFKNIIQLQVRSVYIYL